MSRLYVRTEAALVVLIWLLGLWALYAQAAVIAGVSFSTLRAFSILPLLLTPLLLWIIRRRPRIESQIVASTTPDTPATRLAGRVRMTIFAGAPFAMAALYASTHIDWLFWLLAISYLTVVTWYAIRLDPVRGARDELDPRLEAAAVAALCAIAALLTAGTLRPNADDSYFVNVAIAEVEFADAAPQTFDAMHRSGLPPVQQVLHLPQVYEILVGVLSSVSGVSVSTLYYVLLPPGWAVLGTLAHWVVLGQLLGHPLRRREALWGTAMFVFVLVFWGDGVQTFGNFGFVRLFQGKTAYIVVVLPLIVHAAVRFRDRPDAASWLYLALSQCAAVGLTTNATIVAPLAAALAIVARPRLDRRYLRISLVGVAASLPLIIVTGTMYGRMAAYLPAMAADQVRFGYATTLGAVRTPLVVLALILLPILAARARLSSAEWLAGYVWIVVLVIFMPAVSTLASRVLVPEFSWRLFWAVPMPLLVSLAGGIATSALAARRWRATAMLTIWAVVFAFIGPAAVRANEWSWQNLRNPKVDEALYSVAEATIGVARTDAPVLAPEAVATYLTGFRGAPPLVAVRYGYLQNLRGLIPDTELAMRLALRAYVEEVDQAPPMAAALETMAVARVGTVVFPARHHDAAELVAALASRGFVIQRRRDFVIAARPR